MLYNLQWICWCEFTASKLFVHSANNTSLRWCLWGWLGQTTMIWSCRSCPSFIVFGSSLLVFPSCFCFVFCNNLVNVNVGCVGNVQLDIYFVCINICCSFYLGYNFEEDDSNNNSYFDCDEIREFICTIFRFLSDISVVSLLIIVFQVFF